MPRLLQVGDKVKVPWGLQRDVDGEVVEIWGDPPAQMRVQLHLSDDEGAEPVVSLLSPAALTAT